MGLIWWYMFVAGSSQLLKSYCRCIV